MYDSICQVYLDVASEFSKAAILSPRGDIYNTSFKIAHNLNGFNYLIAQIKKAENVLSMKPIFLWNPQVSIIHHFSTFFKKQL